MIYARGRMVFVHFGEAVQYLFAVLYVKVFNFRTRPWGCAQKREGRFDAGVAGEAADSNLSAQAFPPEMPCQLADDCFERNAVQRIVWLRVCQCVIIIPNAGPREKQYFLLGPAVFAKSLISGPVLQDGNLLAVSTGRTGNLYGDIIFFPERLARYDIESCGMCRQVPHCIGGIVDNTPRTTLQAHNASSFLDRNIFAVSRETKRKRSAFFIL
jgi:hypothetical protein